MRVTDAVLVLEGWGFPLAFLNIFIDTCDLPASPFIS